MIISHVSVKNWRNFKSIDVDLRERQFIVGANASGKSNLLDVFRFLRDIVRSEGGGLQKAVKDRGGISKIRSLAARRDPEIAIDIHLANESGGATIWRYELGLRQETRGYRQTYLTYERVWKGDQQILDRPDEADKKDQERLKQTFLEQINVNADFRNMVRFFQSITYLHLVPQLLRFADSIQGRTLEDDPFGQGLLERIAKVNKRTQRARLSQIEQALKIAVPQLEQLEFTRDEITGRPHLQALYSHWRPKAGKQREDQFSDGTLRLLGLLWSLLEGDSVLLLEEPELSLNTAIVRKLPVLIHRMTRKNKRQVLISTHSADLLSDKGIGDDEVILLIPGAEGTRAQRVCENKQIRDLLDGGLSIGDAAFPHIDPPNMQQLALFEI